MQFDCVNTINCESRVRKVRFNVNGEYCMTCGSDKRVRLWNPYQGRLLKTYSSHANEVLDVDASCDSAQLVSGSSDKSIILWDVSTGQVLRRLRKHAGFVTCVKFNEDSSVVVSGSQDNNVACWDLRSRAYEPFQMLNDAQDCVTSLQVSDHEILTGAADCQVRRYDLRNGQLTVDFLGSVVTSVTLNGDGMCYLASCSDDTIRMMDKLTGELLNEYVGHKTGDYQTEACLSCDGSVVVGGSVTGDIHMWDLLTAKQELRLPHGAFVIQSLAAHPKQHIVLSAATDTVKLWKREDVLLSSAEPSLEST